MDTTTTTKTESAFDRYLREHAEEIAEIRREVTAEAEKTSDEELLKLPLEDMDVLADVLEGCAKAIRSVLNSKGTPHFRARCIEAAIAMGVMEEVIESVENH